MRHLLIAGVALVLGLSWAFARPLPVVDLRTGDPIPGCSLEPVDPIFQFLSEPLVGPLLHLSGLPIPRMASWVLAAVLATFVLHRLAARRSGGRGMPFVGRALPAALLPLPFYWIGLLESELLRLLWPVGAPLLVGGIGLGRVLWRTPRGGRWGAARAWIVRFVGWLGLLLGTLSAFVLAPLPMSRAGQRLRAPDDLLVADLHAHSDTEKDALLGGDGRLELFARHGVELSAVTEHRGLDLPGERWDYARMAELVGGGAPRLLPGAEFTTRALHLVLLGIDREYPKSEYRLRGPGSGKSDPPYHGYDFPRLVADVHRDGGFVIVAHWWSWTQPMRVDWRDLVEWGVDGFEVGSGGERAPSELIERWRAEGLVLLASSDYHHYRKSLYAWTLVDREALGGVDGDPRAITRRLLGLPEAQRRPAMLQLFDPALPVWLEPLVGPWTYFRSLDGRRRLSWLLWLIVAVVLGQPWVAGPAPQSRPRVAAAEPPIEPPVAARRPSLVD